MDKDRRIADLMNINDSHSQTNGDLRVLNNQLLRENDKIKEELEELKLYGLQLDLQQEQ